jgi:two-component system response regulator AtoC
MHVPDFDWHDVIDLQESPFVVIDGDYRIVAANQAYCETYGGEAGGGGGAMLP